MVKAVPNQETERLFLEQFLIAVRFAYKFNTHMFFLTVFRPVPCEKAEILPQPPSNYDS